MRRRRGVSEDAPGSGVTWVASDVPTLGRRPWDEPGRGRWTKRPPIRTGCLLTPPGSSTRVVAGIAARVLPRTFVAVPFHCRVSTLAERMTADRPTWRWSCAEVAGTLVTSDGRAARMGASRSRRGGRHRSAHVTAEPQAAAQTSRQGLALHPPPQRQPPGPADQAGPEPGRSDNASVSSATRASSWTSAEDDDLLVRAVERAGGEPGLAVDQLGDLGVDGLRGDDPPRGDGLAPGRCGGRGRWPGSARRRSRTARRARRWRRPAG